MLGYMLVAGLCTLLATNANAVPLRPGEIIAGPEFGALQGIRGDILFGAHFDFDDPGLFTGWMRSHVFRGHHANPFGGMTFTYEVVNFAESPQSISGFTVRGFAFSQLDVSFDLDYEGVHPASISRDASGNSISILFDEREDDPLAGVVAPGTSNTFIVLHTDATAVRTGFLASIQGSEVPIGVFAPIPEPSSFWLLAVALVGVVASRRRSGTWRQELSECNERAYPEIQMSKA